MGEGSKKERTGGERRGKIKKKGEGKPLGKICF